MNKIADELIANESMFPKIKQFLLHIPMYKSKMIQRLTILKFNNDLIKCVARAIFGIKNQMNFSEFNAFLKR